MIFIYYRERAFSKRQYQEIDIFFYQDIYNNIIGIIFPFHIMCLFVCILVFLSFFYYFLLLRLNNSLFVPRKHKFLQRVMYLLNWF